MKFIKYILPLLLLLVLNLKSGAQNEIEKYLVTAAENNPGLKARYSEYMAALEKIPQVGSLPDPIVAFGYFIQPVETRVGPQQARISVSQMFPWLGTLAAKEDVAIQMAKSKYEMFEEAKSRLFYDIKSTWYNLYFTQHAIQISKDNIDILQTLKKLAVVKIESGKASSVDEIRVEMELLDMENQLLLLVDKLNTLKIGFNKLLNVNNDEDIVIPDSLPKNELVLTKESLLDSIRGNNHQILQLEYLQASNEYQQVVAKKAGQPAFNIGMDYILIGKSDNSMLAAGESGKDAIMLPMVGITIPLYRKKYTSLVKETVFMSESTQHQKADKLNVLDLLFEKADADYRDAKRRVELHEKQLYLAQKALRLLEADYATDGKKFEEILRMDRQVLMHSLEIEKARSDQNAAVAFINYLMGK